MPLHRPSRRRFVAALGVGAVGALAGCSGDSSPTNSSLEWSADEWPVAHGTPTNVGYSRTRNTPRSDPKLVEWKLWVIARSESVIEKETVQHGNVSTPVVADGTVFVATGLPGRKPDGDGALVALDATTGEPEWSARLPDGGSGTPAVADGLVFVGSNDRALTAFDAASGDVRWRTTTGAPVGTPAAAGAHVYVGDREGSVHAFRRTDGTLRWRFGQRPLKSFFSHKRWRIRAKPAVTEDTVYVTTGIGFDDTTETRAGNLLALSRSGGDERWRYEYRPRYRSYDLPRAPVVADGTVYVGQSVLHAVDATNGTKRWRFNSGYETVSAPAVRDGTVYVSSKNVYALSADDGTERWRFVNLAEDSYRDESRVPMESAPVVANGTVYVGAGALDASSGKRLWGNVGNRENDDFFSDLSDANAVVEGPAVTDGAVFVATQYGAIRRATRGDE